jgi:integrase
MRKFYLHTRHHGVYYAELVNPVTGEKLTARSTKTKNKDEALLVVAEWLTSGVPTGRGRKPRPLEEAIGLDAIIKAIKKTSLTPKDALKIVAVLKEQNLIDIPAVAAGHDKALFIPFLKNFWDYEKSPYIREKIARRHRIGRRHCYESQNRTRLYWEPAFKDRTLKSVTREDLKKFSIELAGKNLAPNTINKIMITGTTALSWACMEGMIPADPSDKLLRFSEEGKKRGVLTPEEAAELFSIEWDDERVYAGNLLAITTGLRSGEVLAIRKSDISTAENILYIRHSWNFIDKLKDTKNGEERKAPLLPKVKEKLLEVLEKNPYETSDPFVFWNSQSPDKPLNGKALLNGLKKACVAIGIDPVKRDIVFHSHRHYYAARMTDRMTAEQVSRITGHKSKAVFDGYADHIISKNLEEANAVGEEVFRNILVFGKEA